MRNSFKDYFSSNSSEYANYRPQYPQTLAHALADLCPDKNVALDVACGTGQFSVLLADYFKQVIATDASEQQIQNANPSARVCYRVAQAERSHLPAQSVDMVSVAQAAHWLNLDDFYAEVRRVLKPQGILALITYGVLSIDDAACESIVQDFYHRTLDGYWPPERTHVESGYRTLPFPFDELSFPDLHMQSQWNYHQLVGYIHTWSACKLLGQSNAHSSIASFEDQLKQAWGDLNIIRTITWPLAVRVGRIPD